MAELSVRNLTCTYGTHIALNNITARFPTGKITALIGSNGSGKSTLLETLAGTLAPRSGSINNLVPEIAFVPQRSHVSHNLPNTIRQTVSMGRWSAKKNWQRLTAADRNIVDSCLDRLEISDLADRPPRRSIRRAAPTRPHSARFSATGALIASRRSPRRRGLPRGKSYRRCH